MSVEPTWRNYFTVKFWGGDDNSAVSGQASDMGRLYLYVPASQFTPGSSNNYQIGYRHEGDYICLNVSADHPPLPGRFFYSTTLLPLWMTQGRTNLTLKIVSTGRIYPLGSSGTPPNNNYQFFMTTNSRSIYSVYTHTAPLFVPTGEVQGSAPASSWRPSPTSSIMSIGGTFQSGVDSYISGRLSTSVTNLTTSQVEALARSWFIPNLPSGYHQPAVINQVIAACDYYASNYYANPSTSVSTGGGNESWGGRFGPLGHAISVLLPQLQSSLDLTNNYGVGGNVSRRKAWGDMLVGSRDYGRFNRDGHNISNQGMISDQNIFMANLGLLALTNASAFSEADAERYLREAVGLSPWLGSDLAGGGSSLQHGTNYYMVTPKGLTREWGYVGNAYGEIGYYAANFYQYTGNPIYRDQAVKMVKARAPFRRPALETINSTTYYRDMEGIGLLAWRGANESDGDYADAMAYGDRTQWTAGMRVAGVSLDPTVLGYAYQALNDDNEYFSQLISDPRYYSGGSLAANSFDGRNAVDAFADFQAVTNAPDSGIRLPMNDTQPDFAWADEEDGIVAVKHGGDRLWLETYWQAKTGTGVNGIGRFHFSTTNYDQYGVLETSPQIAFSGSFYIRPNIVDKPEQNFYVPPDNPIQAYQGERLPLGANDPLATDDAPFRGKALFWACRYGNYLIGINRSSTQNFQLQTPAGFTSAPDLISGQVLSAPVYVGASSTVVLNLSTSADPCPPPLPPLSLNAVGDNTPRVSLDWSASSGATAYNVKRSTARGGPYTLIAAGITATNYTDSSVNRGTVYYYVMSGTNACGESYYTSMEATASAGLPAPWADADIGSVGVPGSGSCLNGSFTVKGEGLDIGSSSDSFHFTYQPMTNDGTIIAHLASEQFGGALDDKVGLMMRDSTNTASRMAAVLIDGALGKARLPTRASANGSMSWLDGPSTAAPKWFKLQRAANTFTGSVSDDGSSWAGVGTNSVTLGNTVLVGFAVCSRNTGTLNVSTFDNVTVPGWPLVPAAPSGLLASAGDAQVTLNWNAVTNATGYNLKRSLSSGGNYSTIVSTSATNLTDAGVVNGTSYFYIVTATNVAGESAGSAVASAHPLSLAPPLAAFVVSGGQIQLSWPQDHNGWYLQTQTNSTDAGLGTNWFTIPNSNLTNQFSVLISPGNGSVFFRLVSP
jgi:fibronectin type 3 domain-containing protein